MTIFVICVGSSLLSKATDVTLASHHGLQEGKLQVQGKRKCRRRSKSPSAKRARKKRSCSRCIFVKRKTHSKRRYSRESSSESSSQSSSESSLQFLAEYSPESSTSPSPKKKHGSGSKHQSAGLIKQKKLSLKYKLFSC